MTRLSEVSGAARPTLRPVEWQELRRRLLARLRRFVPFGLGVVATLLGLYLYNALNPPAPPLTAAQVNAVVAEAMAQATPAPAFSAQVYQVIQPSLVLITTDGAAPPQQASAGLKAAIPVRARRRCTAWAAG